MLDELPQSFPQANRAEEEPWRRPHYALANLHAEAFRRRRSFRRRKYNQRPTQWLLQEIYPEAPVCRAIKGLDNGIKLVLVVDNKHSPPP